MHEVKTNIFLQKYENWIQNIRPFNPIFFSEF